MPLDHAVRCEEAFYLFSHLRDVVALLYKYEGVSAEGIARGKSMNGGEDGRGDKI